MKLSEAIARLEGYAANISFGDDYRNGLKYGLSIIRQQQRMIDGAREKIYKAEYKCGKDQEETKELLYELLKDLDAGVQLTDTPPKDV